ncbi:MAG: hypothetical protein ABR556_12060 [Pyrinomonadaceae bacterium]
MKINILKVRVRPTTREVFKFCVVVLGVCFLVFVFSVNQKAFAQKRDQVVSGCKLGVDAPRYGFWTWAAKSRVKVFILASSFKPAELPHVLRPLETWNAVADLSTSHVQFVYMGMAAEMQTCDNCLTIMRGPVAEKRHAAELQAASKNRDQIISYARIILDPRISDFSALTNAVAHELGHNFGLFDCFACHGPSTVMSYIRKSGGLDGPTACDVAQIKAAYEELKRYVRPAPVQARLVIADEGEEPVEDDTPIVIPPPESK